MNRSYDIIVVGGGHAGCEAAMAASRMGSSVLLISMDMAKFAQMSCNPVFFSLVQKLRAFVRLQVQYSILRQLSLPLEPSLMDVCL